MDNTYIPRTVRSVGANVFRNNANKLFIQSSEEDIGNEWQSTWSNYFTGDIYYQVESGSSLNYTAILNAENEKIGYEVQSYQFIDNAEADIVVYDSIKTDEDSMYYPVLNICSEAFTFSKFNSITLKKRRSMDETAPEFTHNINVRSNAFLSAFCNTIVFDTDINIDHPQNLQGENTSIFDGSAIVGDEEHSIKLFEESTVKEVILPSSFATITDRMFYHCAYLESIKFVGKGGNNILYSVQSIGDNAFGSCVGLLSITLPSSIEQIGNSAFDSWGDGENSQTIDIDFYYGYLPSGWSPDWFGGNAANTVIRYKSPVSVTIDLQDGKGGKNVINVIPNKHMPTIEKPQRMGYEFKGIFSETNGHGVQYYTADTDVGRLWKENDLTTLYAYWQIVEYSINYDSIVAGLYNPNVNKYTVEDRVVLEPLQDEAYIYTFYPDVIEKGTVGDILISCTKKPRKFAIEYIINDLKGNVNGNKEVYDITDEIVFENLSCEGYAFSWSPTSIPKGSTGPKTVIGTWTPNTYNIVYKVYNNVTVVEPLTYTYGVDLNINPVIRGGYFVTWDKTVIPAGTIGDVTVTAVEYTEKSLNACYDNGVYEIWTLLQFNQLRSQPNYCSGREYRLMAQLQIGQDHISYYFTPLTEFRGVLDGNGNYVVNYTLESSGGGNIGFCRKNYGTIKNLTLGMGFNIPSSMSNVNVGSFAGINYGNIFNCTFMFPGSSGYKCKAGGISYAGVMVGINNGTIEDCTGGAWLEGSCNMGMVAGKNIGTIRNCHMGHSNAKIKYEYDGINNVCIGGIVGLQTSGSIINCSFVGMVFWGNLDSKIVDNRTVQPCGGIIIGRKQGGTVSGNSWKLYSGQKHIVIALADYHIVEWKSGNITYTHDQWLYYKDEECGRIG